jgi:hypothetical protein
MGLPQLHRDQLTIHYNLPILKPGKPENSALRL